MSSEAIRSQVGWVHPDAHAAVIQQRDEAQMSRDVALEEANVLREETAALQCSLDEAQVNIQALRRQNVDIQLALDEANREDFPSRKRRTVFEKKQEQRGPAVAEVESGGDHMNLSEPTDRNYFPSERRITKEDNFRDPKAKIQVSCNYHFDADVRNQGIESEVPKSTARGQELEAQVQKSQLDTVNASLVSRLHSRKLVIPPSDPPNSEVSQATEYSPESTTPPTTLAVKNPAQIAAAEKQAKYLLLFPDDGLTKEEEDAAKEEQLKAFQLKLERYRAKVEKRNQENQQSTSEPKPKTTAPSTNKLSATTSLDQGQRLEEGIAPLPASPKSPFDRTAIPIDMEKGKPLKHEEPAPAAMRRGKPSRKEELIPAQMDKSKSSEAVERSELSPPASAGSDVDPWQRLLTGPGSDVNKARVNARLQERLDFLDAGRKAAEWTTEMDELCQSFQALYPPI